MAFDVSSIFADDAHKYMQVHPVQAVDVPRSPETLGSEIRYLSAQAKSMTVWFGVEIGKRLAEAKESVTAAGWSFSKPRPSFPAPPLTVSCKSRGNTAVRRQISQRLEI